MNKEIDIEVLMKLFDTKKSKSILINSLRIFKVTKVNRFQQGCLYALALIAAMFVGMTPLTTIIFADSVQMIIDIILALFGIVFTGYAFFQALINDEFLIRLVKETSNVNSEEICKLQETNESFVEDMFLNLLAITLSLVLKIIIDSIPTDFTLFKEILYNNLCAGILISMYYYFVFTVVWEIKSFILNILKLFNIYAGTRMINLYKDEEKR